jgi:glutamate synthase (ferredoxin)
MAGSGKETTYSMGDHTPLLVLSMQPHTPYNNLKQQFVQVTNPPLDLLREGVVKSFGMTLGKKESIHKVPKRGASLIQLDSPILNTNEMECIPSLVMEEKEGFKQASISVRHTLSDRPKGIRCDINNFSDRAVEDVMASR